MVARELRRPDSGNGDDNGPDTFGPVCKAEDLRGLLLQLSNQISDADRRNIETLRDMRGRLERLGAQADVIKQDLPAPLAADLERIEHGMSDLAHRIETAEESRTRAGTAERLDLVAAAVGPDIPHTALATSASRLPQEIVTPLTVAQANPVAPRATAATPPPALRSALMASAAIPMEKPVVVSPQSTILDDEPWDASSAAALTRLYDSGAANLAPAPVAAMPVVAPVQPEVPIMRVISDSAPVLAVAAVAPAAAAATVRTQSGFAHTDDDRAWLDQRLADVAKRIENSLSELKPEGSLADFGRRFDQFEERWNVALTDVATRADVEGLRLVEAHIAELSNQLEQTQANLARLDAIETQLSDLSNQLTDDQIIRLFGNLVPTEEDLTRFADKAARQAADRAATKTADEILSRMPASQESHAAIAAGPVMLAGASLDAVRTASNEGIGQLQSMLAKFIEESRKVEAEKTEALDTIQHAMQVVLDRVDAIEQARQPMSAPAQVPQPHHAMPLAPVNLDAPYDPFEQAKASAKAAAAAVASAAPSAPTAMKSNGAAAPGKRVEPEFNDPSFDLANVRSDAVTRLTPQQTQAADRRSVLDSARRAAEQAKVASTVADAAAKSKGGGVRDRLLGGAAQEGVGGNNVKRLLVPAVGAIALVGALVGTWVMTKPKPGTATAAHIGQSVPAGKASSKPSATPAVDTEDEPDTPAAKPEAGPAAGDKPKAAPSVPGKQGRIQGGDEQGIAAQMKRGGQEQAELQRPMVVAGGAGIMVQQSGREPTPEEAMRAREQMHAAAMSERAATNAAARQASQPSVIPASMKQMEEPPQTEVRGERKGVVEMPPALVGPTSLRMAAANGDPSAQFEVAARFAEGKGVKQDFTQAGVWYQRAAAQGFAAAQYRLAALHERGLGVPIDASRARNWYMRAAEQGNVKAMHNLAVLSAGREQGSADYPTAAQWFTEAAERGLSDSQYNLGVLHESGLGVPKNVIAAYKWYAIAARGGDKEAARRQQVLRGKLDAVALQQAEESITAWQARSVDQAANDPVIAGSAWRARAAASGN